MDSHASAIIAISNSFYLLVFCNNSYGNNLVALKTESYRYLLLNVFFPHLISEFSCDECLS